ncbi:hypothetical protein BD410DRAFT_303591 [Rickenella mellea]|uniref:Uncharacterized protein n=1 Tax=Rickenella mellea TaxID=50990 RepID=A0A4Y7Q165_9AGAM|nr:hypothetical protein BD410DRAFT_303591 [Rickenella mellea]
MVRVGFEVLVKTKGGKYLILHSYTLFLLVQFLLARIALSRYANTKHLGHAAYVRAAPSHHNEPPSPAPNYPETHQYDSKMSRTARRSPTTATHQ